MHKLLEQYGIRGALYAPPGEGNGNGSGDDTGDNNGTGNGDGGDTGGSSGDDQGSDGGAGKSDQSKLKGGLFDKRTKGKDGDGKADDPPKAGADGRPAHIPEKFWDPKTKTVKHDDLAKAYGTLEQAHATLKRSKGVGDDVPEKPEEYFPEAVPLEGAEKFGKAIEPDDPGLKTWGKVAHKWGVGRDAAIGMAKDMFKGMNEFAPTPVDPDAEFEKLGNGGQELVDGVFVWAEGLEKEGKFGEDDIQQVIDLSGTAAGIRFLAKVRGMTGERPIPLGDPSGGGRMSQEDWHTAYRAAVNAKDYKEQERLDGISANIFGSDPSTGSNIAGIPNQKDVDRHAKK